ncbi:MAG: hypothetical protein AAGA74_05385 [Pseudomonadota bacterium]
MDGQDRLPRAPSKNGTARPNRVRYGRSAFQNPNVANLTPLFCLENSPDRPWKTAKKRVSNQGFEFFAERRPIIFLKFLIYISKPSCEDCKRITQRAARKMDVLMIHPKETGH